MSPIDLVLLVAFAAAWPLQGAWIGVPALRAAVAAGTPGARRAEYATTMFMQWMFAALAAAAALEHGRNAAALRLAPPAGAGLGTAAIFLVAGGAFLFLQLRAGDSATARAAVRRQVAPLAWFLPQDAADRRLFRPLSLTAGVCEEWLFRGWLPAVFAPSIGVPGAFVASTVLFGLAHAYQGPKGIARTGIVGAVFALMAWSTGSIWPGVVLHAAVDWVQGDLVVRSLGDAPDAEPATA